MSHVPAPQLKGWLSLTCSASCLSTWWSVAAPQAGHQERGSHSGLAAAVLGYTPVAQPEGYLDRQRKHQVLRDFPSEGAENHTFPKNLPMPSSLLSCRECGVRKNFALFILLHICSWMNHWGTTLASTICWKYTKCSSVQKGKVSALEPVYLLHLWGFYGNLGQIA